MKLLFNFYSWRSLRLSVTLIYAINFKIHISTLELKPPLKLLDWYIIKKYLGTFFFTLAIFTVISVVFDISEKLDDFLKSNATMSEIVFQYYGGFIPFYLNFLSPLINFIAVIFFTAKMADQTEIVPILCGKASFNRFFTSLFSGFNTHFYSQYDFQSADYPRN